MRVRIWIVIACFVLGSALATPPAAAAPPLPCGSVVSQDVQLSADMVCTGTALVVRGNAQPVTIDLNGHTIHGTDPSIGFTGAVIVDGSVTAAREPVTVTNGTLAGHNSGVAIYRATGVTVERVRFRHNRAGVRNLDVTAGLTVRRSHFRDNTTTYANGWSAGGMTFEHNTVIDSGLVSLSQGGSNTFRRNVFVRSGITAWMAPRNLIEHNTFTGADVAVRLRHLSGYATVRRNTFTGNGVGLVIDDVTGSLHPSSGDATVVGNAFVRNDTAGMVVDLPTSQPAMSERVVVTDNRFTGNGHAPDGTTDLGGTAVDAGLHVFVGAPAVVPVTITGNRAVANGGAGIAAYGAVDGGGNTAHGNGGPAQCVGVAC